MKNNPPRIVFFGTPDFAASILKSLLVKKLAEVPLVITQPDRPGGRGQKLVPSPVKAIALEHNIPVLQPERIKRTEQVFRSQLKEFGAFDLGLVVAFGQILPKSVLSFPTQGCVNVHASLLPRWRGASPIQHALLHGDDQTGICLMKMDIGLDTGDVYSQAVTKIESEDNFGSLHDRLIILANNLIESDLSEIASGQKKATSQSSQGITYASKLEGPFNKIDWSKGVLEIRNLINACAPFPGAFSFLDQKRFKILKAQPLKQSKSSNTEVGSINVANNEISVQAQDGVINILELQLEGKRVMSASEFLAGNRSLFSSSKKLG